MTIILLLCGIIVVSFALWRSSIKQRKNAPPMNRYKPQAKKPKVRAHAKRKKPARIKAEKEEKAAKPKRQKPVRGHAKMKKVKRDKVEKHERVAALNLREGALSDGFAESDSVLGLDAEGLIATHTSMGASLINGGEPVILYLAADHGEHFSGDELLQAILSTGAHVNDHGIFERYSEGNSQGVLIYSMASMLTPGVFDVDAMDEHQTPGLVFYIMDPASIDLFRNDFDVMMHAMTKIQAQIGGHIFTPDKILLEPCDFDRYCDYLCGAHEQEPSEV